MDSDTMQFALLQKNQSKSAEAKGKGSNGIFALLQGLFEHHDDDGSVAYVQTGVPTNQRNYLFYSSKAMEWRVGRWLHSKLYVMSIASTERFPEKLSLKLTGRAVSTSWQAYNSISKTWVSQDWTIKCLDQDK
jgi:hypothetical protein